MGLHATGLNRSVKSADAKTLHAGRLNIGPRLILGFVFIILSMLAADAVILWQFHVVRIQAGHLNDIDQKLVAVLRVHTSMLAFHDRLDGLADAEDADRLVKEGGPLRTAVLEDIRRATSALSLPPFDPRRDPTILPTLHVIKSALTSELEAITTLATSGDWRAVHLRLANQVRPLESLTSALVEKVDNEAGEQQAQTVLNIRRVQRLVFWIVPLTAIFTLLIAATLGLAITRSITQPLARLVEGSKALARGEFQHQVSVTGKDELAHLGQVFNDTARRLGDLYATLQSSEDRLRLVIDTIPAYAWSARPDGSVDFINQRFLEFTGRSMEDILGWGWGSLFHPDDLTRYVGESQAAVATGERMESEARVRRMDGDYRWLLIRNVPLRDELGNIVNWYGTAIDIEERHRAEDALRRSEAYLAEAQRLSKTGSFGWNVSTGEIRWSEETYKIFEYDRAVKPTLELVFQRSHPDDRDRVQQTIDRAAEARANFYFEHRLLMADGSVKHVHVVARALSDESGSVEFVGAVMDVTVAKQAEETLRESEAYLAEAQRLSHTGSWAGAPGTGKIRYWSEECYRVLGFDPHGGQPRFETFFQRIHPDDQAKFRETAETAALDKVGFEFDYQIVHPGGEIRDIHTVGHPVFSPSGDLVEFVGTVIDVTERKRAEEERERLRQVQADLAHLSRVTTMGELTAALAHEVNQPIAAAVTDAKTCLRWLARDQPDLEEAREAASRIVKDAIRATEIIKRTRLLFKKGPPQRELVDANEVIREMVVLLRGEAAGYSISVRTELAEDLPQVMGDRMQLQQVLMNLIMNSIDAMKDVDGTRELTINSQRGENEHLVVSVSDTGVGLPPQRADQIFNAFFTTKPHGTGMGLRISRSIVESHGGRLWAADNSPRGASFCFTLPTEPRHRNDTRRLNAA
jgi:PAS domain S-box-containing protein